MKTGKRLKLMVVAALLLLLPTSCHKHVQLAETDVINVGAGFDEATRAIITDKTVLQTQSSGENGFRIGVFGLKTPHSSGETGNSFSGTPYLVFNNQQVEYSTNAWTYSPTKYWDRNAYYKFIGYWPQGANATYANNIVELTIPNWQEVGNATTPEKDYLIASSQGTAVDYIESHDKTVNFEFRHLLAQFIIRAYYVGDKDTQPVISSLPFGANEAGKKVPTEASATANGVFGYSINIDGTGAAYNGSGASLTDGALAGAKDVIGSGNVKLPTTAYAKDMNGDVPVFDEGNGYSIVRTWLVAPFTSGGTDISIPIQVTYKLGDEGSPTTSQAKPTKLTSMAAGNTYILTLKFDTNSDGLELQTVEVLDWIDKGNNNLYFYNW